MLNSCEEKTKGKELPWVESDLDVEGGDGADIAISDANASLLFSILAVLEFYTLFS